MKKITIAVLAFILIVGIVIAAFAIGSSIKSNVSPEELERMENESSEKYSALLKAWSKSPDIIDDRNMDYPEFYGGAYINDGKKLVIQATNLDESTKDYFKSIIDTENVIFEKVKYPYTELLQVNDEIAYKMYASPTDTLISKITGVGLSLPDNAVELHIAVSEKEAKSDALRDEIREKLSQFENIKITPNSDYDTPAESGYPWGIEKTAIKPSSINENITIKIDNSTLTPSGAKYTVQNNDTKKIEFGSEYFIQVYKDGEWYDIKKYSDWTMELYILQSGKENEFDAKWGSFLGKLPEGKYRLGKEFAYEYKPDCELFYAFCEFEIK